MTETPALTPRDIAAIQALYPPFVERLVAGDFEALTRLYTDDAMILPPNHAAVRGKEEILRLYAITPRIVAAEFVAEEVGGGPDVAFVRGRYVMTLEPDGAKVPVEDRGKYVELRKRQPDGSWPLWRDIFNSDLAPVPGDRPTEGAAAGMSSGERVIREWFDALNKGKSHALAALDEVIADDYVQHDPQTPVEGRGATREFVSAILDAFPDFHVTIEEVIAAGDRVVYRAMLSGTHRGEFMGIAATGRTFETPLISVARMKDGRIADEWQVWDVMGMMRQIGAPPATA